MKSKVRISKIIWSIICVIALSAVASISANKISVADYKEMSDSDRLMFDALSQVYNVFEQNPKEIWTENFLLHKRPIVLYDKNGLLRGSTYVVNIDLSKSLHAKKVAMPNDFYGGDVYRVTGIHPSLFALWRQSKVVTIGEICAVALIYNKSTINDGSFINNLVYDGYLLYAREKSKITLPLEYESEVIAYNDLISRILESETEKEKNTTISDLISAREEQSKNNLFADRYITINEMYHGAALYCVVNIARALESEYTVSIDNPLAQSGEALGRILDNLPIGSGWRCAVENSEEESLVTQYSLLREYCRQNM